MFTELYIVIKFSKKKLYKFKRLNINMKFQFISKLHQMILKVHQKFIYCYLYLKLFKHLLKLNIKMFSITLNQYLNLNISTINTFLSYLKVLYGLIKKKV